MVFLVAGFAQPAHQAVEHDDVNVLTLGSRVIGPVLAEEIVFSFLGATFSGNERHVRRVGKVIELENRFGGVEL